MVEHFFIVINQSLKKSMNKIFMLIGIFICLISACSSEKENTQKNETAQSYPVISPALIDTVYTKDYVAEIQSVQNVEIRSKTKGIIEKVWVDEGKYVAAGQTIYSINNSALRVELAKAESQIKTILAEKKTLEIELENTKKLVENKIVSKSEQAMVESKIATNDAQIEEIKTDIEGIKLQMSYSQIKAPFSGILNRHLLNTGSLVEENTALTSISNNNEVFAYFNVSEREYLDFVAKKRTNNLEKVDLILANGENYPFKGIIETIEGEFNQETGNIAFRARFTNPEKVLRHGATGKIRLNQSVKGAIIIPQKVTIEVQDKTYIYVVNAQNIVEQRAIMPIVRLDNMYIVDGVNPSDKIIYEGLQTIKVGDKVTIKTVNFR
jgi:membrane fusion protein (multidrug efflux system)